LAWSSPLSLIALEMISTSSNLEITADGDLVLKANLSSQTDINLTSHHGKITQSGDIKAVQNIDIIVVYIFTI
jgi:hypothetical protein